MNIKPIRVEFVEYLQKHNLVKKFSKQVEIFKTDPRHPSLHTETLEPKSLKLHSFRIDKKYRAIFVVTAIGEAEIIDINDHYQ